VPKATGGRGTDTIPALLSPGEFVVNRKSPRQKFYSQLLAITIREQRFASGVLLIITAVSYIPITVESEKR
jgi:hypothetical protein